MLNQYYILRHGQNVYQAEKRDVMYPWPDKPPVKLSKEGKQKIKEAAEQLKSKKIDLIYSSDIYRAKQTSGIMAKELGIKKINFDKRLRDINLGVYHGKTKKEFYNHFPDAIERFSHKPKRGETWNEVKKRMLDFLRDIDKKYKNKKILIVSHGDPLWLLEGAVKGLTNRELLKELFKNKNYIKVGELRKLSPH